MWKDLYKHHIIDPSWKPSEVMLALFTRGLLGLREVVYPAAATELVSGRIRIQIHVSGPQSPVVLRLHHSVTYCLGEIVAKQREQRLRLWLCRFTSSYCGAPQNIPGINELLPCCSLCSAKTHLLVFSFTAFHSIINIRLQVSKASIIECVLIQVHKTGWKTILQTLLNISRSISVTWLWNVRAFWIHVSHLMNEEVRYCKKSLLWGHIGG